MSGRVVRVTVTLNGVPKVRLPADSAGTPGAVLSNTKVALASKDGLPVLSQAMTPIDVVEEGMEIVAPAARGVPEEQVFGAFTVVVDAVA